MKDCIGEIVINFEKCRSQAGPFKEGDIIEIVWPDGDISEVVVLDARHLPNGAIKLELEPVVNEGT